MKRTVLNILLIFTFLLASCTTGAGGGPADTSAAPEQTDPVIERTDADFDNRFGMGTSNFVETEDAYYYNAFAGYFIYYYDKASGERGVLCAKPECVHDEIAPNPSCNGYTFLLSRSLNLWDGKLHYVGWDESKRLPALYSLSLDGSVRERGVELDFWNGDGAPQRLDYHRGMLYGWGMETSVVNGAPNVRGYIVGVDAETGEARYIFEGNYPNGKLDFCLYYLGKYVYICVADCTELTDEDYLEKTKLTLYRWNIETEELETVFSTGEKSISGQVFQLWIPSEDRIYILATAISSTDPARVYKLSGGELEPVFEFGFRGVSGMIDGAAICISITEEKAEIRTADGDLIYEGEWSFDFGLDVEYTMPCYIHSGYGDKDTLFLVYLIRSSDLPGQGSCVMRYDLTGEKPEATLIAFSPWD